MSEFGSKGTPVYVIIAIVVLVEIEIISQKGLSNVTVDGLVEDITPRARGTITSLCCMAKMFPQVLTVSGI